VFSAFEEQLYGRSFVMGKMVIRYASLLAIALGLAVAMGTVAALLFANRVSDSLLGGAISM
jgi:hypothetical protein